MRLVGIFGGTFNPIHFGHLRIAQELADALALDEVKFVPSANPPHKDNVIVSAERRSAMVKMTIADNPLFSVDELELNRGGASYTIDTLISLRESLGKDSSLCLMMGSDAFIQLNTWNRWQELLDYAHILLVQRPSAKPQEALPSEVKALLRDHYTDQHADLNNENSGAIIMQQIAAQDVSSTHIRHLLQHGESVRYLMPDVVVKYINQHQLYQK
ncbi:MAG: nicotinate-nucleotide adenylyltransferase [Methylophilaceae bacterium]